MFEVIYYSMSGNTRKIAETIAEELGVEAEEVKTKQEPGTDSFVFLGSGCYGSRPWKGMQEFIKRNDFKGRQVALFGTSASGVGSEVKAMEKMLTAESAFVKGSFYCKGKSFRLLNRKHPTDEELARAREFASEMKKP